LPWISTSRIWLAASGYSRSPAPGVVVLEQELAVAVLDDRLRVGLDLGYHPQDFGDLDVERRLGAVENIAVGVGGLVAVVHQLCVGADLAIVAGDELEEAQDAALVHGAEHEGQSRVEEALLDVLAEADEAHREILWRRLLDLPDVEIDEAHREHVVGEEGELIFAMRVVRLESDPQKLDIFLLLRGLEGERQVVGEFGGFFHCGTYSKMFVADKVWFVGLRQLGSLVLQNQLLLSEKGIPCLANSRSRHS
jgi:hypothetical protein